MHKFGGHCSAHHSEVWTCLSQTPPPKGRAGLVLLLGEKENEASQGTDTTGSGNGSAKAVRGHGWGSGTAETGSGPSSAAFRLQAPLSVKSG